MYHFTFELITEETTVLWKFLIILNQNQAVDMMEFPQNNYY